MESIIDMSRKASGLVASAMKTTKTDAPPIFGNGTDTHTNTPLATTERLSDTLEVFLRLWIMFMNSCSRIWTMSIDIFFWLGGMILLLYTRFRGKMSSAWMVLPAIPLVAYPISIVGLMVLGIIYMQYKLFRRTLAAYQKHTALFAQATSAPGGVLGSLDNPIQIHEQTPTLLSTNGLGIFNNHIQVPEQSPILVSANPLTMKTPISEATRPARTAERDQWYVTRLLPKVRTACVSATEASKVTSMMLERPDAELDACLSGPHFLQAQVFVMLVALRMSKA